MEFEVVEIPTYARECVGCGNEFVTENAAQKRCAQHCARDSKTSKNKVRSEKNLEHDVEFIAVDGEGISVTTKFMDYDSDLMEEFENESDTTEDQVYVMLSVGDKTLHKNGKRLTHYDIFPFLYDQYLEHPDATFVGFYLSYDFTMWLKSLDEERARELLTKDGIAARKATSKHIPQPWPVRDGGKVATDEGYVYTKKTWEFDILGMKRFRLRPFVKREDFPRCEKAHKTKEQVEECATGMHDKHPYGWMYINDVGPFFQAGFVTVIDPKDLPADHPSRYCTDEEFDIIMEGKKERSNAAFDDAMLRYNLLENEILARVMKKLNYGLVHMPGEGVRLSKEKWYGPGQAAQAWLSTLDIPTSKEINGYYDDGGKWVNGSLPQFAKDAAKASYYGGWFEIFNHGPVPGTSYEYDINSAYPAIIADLPCLREGHGVWETGKGKPPRFRNRTLRLVKGTFVGEDTWAGPLPYRAPDQSIFRPNKVKGWYWWHEVKMSAEAGLLNLRKSEIEEWVDFHPTCKCEPPLAAIRELYQERLRVGKETPQGKAMKIVYNSAYGKFAQSIGLPRYANAVYGSLITAGCRVKILEAIATHPTKTKTLLMVATDGIYFKSPHPKLDLSETELGKWGMKKKENLSLFMPGVYWDDKARETIRQGKTPALKSRGVNAKHLATIIDVADAQWARTRKEMSPDVPKPEVDIYISWSMKGAKQAITQGNWDECGKNYYNVRRTIRADPSGKRESSLISHKAAMGGLRSYPYESPEVVGLPVETTYYKPRFGDEYESDDEFGDLINSDGALGDIVAQALGMRA